MLAELSDIKGKSPEESIEIIANYLRTNKEILEYILTHLDSSNIIEIDTGKTIIYKEDENGVQQRY